MTRPSFQLAAERVSARERSLRRAETADGIAIGLVLWPNSRPHRAGSGRLAGERVRAEAGRIFVEAAAERSGLGRADSPRVWGEAEPAVQFVQDSFDDGVQRRLARTLWRPTEVTELATLPSHFLEVGSGAVEISGDFGAILMLEGTLGSLRRSISNSAPVVALPYVQVTAVPFVCCASRCDSSLSPFTTGPLPPWSAAARAGTFLTPSASSS
jgi:hypothetical protein